MQLKKLYTQYKIQFKKTIYTIQMQLKKTIINAVANHKN